MMTIFILCNTSRRIGTCNIPWYYRLAPPKKPETSPRNMKGSQVADAPWEVGAYTSQRCKSWISHWRNPPKTSKKTRKQIQGVHTSSVNSSYEKNKKYLKTILICIFWRWVHQVLSFFPNTSLNLILPEEIWTHRPSSTTQPESFHKDSPKNNPSPVEGLEYKFPPQINPSFSIERIHLAFFSHYILLVTFCFHSFFILFFGGRGKSSRSFETSIIYRSKMAMYFPNF